MRGGDGGVGGVGLEGGWEGIAWRFLVGCWALHIVELCGDLEWKGLQMELVG